MKLKEKLAQDFEPFAACVEEIHLGCLTRDAFLAGFEKAREMSIEVLNKHPNQACLHEYDLIANVGEEEVGEVKE